MTLLMPKYDLYDPEVMADPYPIYAELRDAGPVCRGGPAQFAVTRYREVFDLMSDRRLSGSFSGDHHRLSIGEGPASDFFTRIILNQDPPDHTRVRRLMGQAVTPSFVRNLAPRLTVLVDELLAPAYDGAGFDAIGDLAYPLPLRVLGETMAIPAADLDEVGWRAIEVARAFAAVLDEAEREAAHRSVTWLVAFIGDLLAERRRTPGDDLLSRLAAAHEGDDRLTDEEIIENVVFTLFAGFETSTGLIGSGCAALIEHPDQFARFRADPSLVPTAVDEFLRWDAPIQVKLRLTREAVTIGDRTIRAGRVLVLLLGSANHDEREFADPERLDVGRTHNPHLSFGGGHHRCIGAALARSEAAVVFDRLAQRFSSLAAAGPPKRHLRPGFRIYDAVPVAAEVA